MANSQGQAQAALNQVNSKIAALTSQINSLQSKIDKSLQSKASRLSDAEQDNIADQIDSLKSQRGDLQEEAARLAEQANPGASDKKAAERQQERASMKQGWNDEVEASKTATKTGPAENRPKTAFSDSRTTSTEEVTGGGTTTTKSADPTPAQQKYYGEYKAAQEADTAANNAQREEYLRSKGLDGATPAQKRAAIRDAREKGDLPPEKEPGSDFKAANPNPPPGMPSTVTTTAGENTSKTTETVESEGARGNTAGDAVTAAERPPIVNEQAGISEDSGTGKDVSGNPTAEKLTDEEKQQLKDSQKTAGTNETVVQPVTNPDGSETVVTTDGKDATQSKEGTLRNAGDVLRSGQASNQDKNLSVGNTPSDTTANPVRINYTPNPLHSYATYTYSISLHLLTPEAYNDLADGKEWLPKAKTLIAGGGRWGTDTTNKNTFTRATQFKDDFYFDGLNVDTIIGMNAQSRGTNAYDFRFNIIEPYGFTLINRLLELSIELNQPNYLANPYVLQIDFFGNDDAGDVVYPLTDSKGRSLTKYLPCKLSEVKIKVGTSGATYACRALPYNHTAFSSTIATTPANFEITAKTVQDFFTNDSDDAGIQRQAEEKQKQRETLAAKQRDNPYATATYSKYVADIENSIKAPYKTRSYTGAYNAFQQYLKDGQKIDHPTTIKFDIDPEIGKALIVDRETNSATSSPAVDSKDTKEVAAQVNGGRSGKKGTPPSAGFKNEQARFNVNAGDAIIDIINKVMRNSSYITDQLKDPLKLDADGKPLNADNQGRPIKWFKITPKVKLQNFDARRNQWALEVTYQIRQYTYHNSKHPAVPVSSQDEIRKNLRKKYSYIYTGANSDIIDFSIDFNTLFYTEVNVLTENTNRTTNSAGSQNEAATTEDLKQDGEIDKTATKQVMPRQQHPTSGDASGQAGLNVTNNSLAQKAADVMKSIYSHARGDMINLKLKIIGDPEFIKTDDIFYNVGNVNAIDGEDTQAPDGSILMDRGDIFVLVTWKTPVDIDYENTGLPDFTRYQYSVFDGVFKVVKVNSEFKSGKFEQSLELIRYHDAVTDPDISKSIAERGGQVKNVNVTALDNKTAEKDLPEGSTSDVDRARDTENTENINSNDPENKKLANVAENGDTKTAEQQATDANSSKDGTTPRTSDAQTQSPQADGGPPVKNEGGSQPQSDNPPKIDNNNLPSGVTQDPDTGLYLYRGRRFSANDSADLAAKTKAIDDGTTVKTTKTDAESGQKKDVEFNGGSPAPRSKDSVIEDLQADYDRAKQAAATAQRRLDFANSGKTDDDPVYKQKIIDNNTKVLNESNAKMAALEAQLKDKGAAPN